jgi:hypothetical protein
MTLTVFRFGTARQRFGRRDGNHSASTCNHASTSALAIFFVVLTIEIDR